MRRPIVVGNWKMNGNRASISTLLTELLRSDLQVCELVVCPPSLYLFDVATALQGSTLAWGGQDCSDQEGGAFTGEVAASMLHELGCRWVIVGHSERRRLHGESDQLVAQKARKALADGLTPIVCLGETLLERQAGQTTDIVQRQLNAVIDVLGSSISDIVVAYEPVWAIGSGLTATPEQAQEVHAFLRRHLAQTTPLASQMRLLYGGSIQPDNAKALFAQADIDGGLVGGAALKSASFLAIARACAEHDEIGEK